MSVIINLLLILTDSLQKFTLNILHSKIEKSYPKTYTNMKYPY